MNWWKKMQMKYADWRTKPRERVRNDLLESLLQLRRDLSTWRGYSKDHTGDPMWNIVRFFNAVGARHDRCGEIGDMIAGLEGVNYGQHDRLINLLKRLKSSFEKAGRDQYGMNRTKPGQLVVDGNVFLGGIYGTMTFSVSQWKELFARNTVDSKRAKEIIYDQAERFIVDHSEIMMDLIEHVQHEVCRYK